MLDRFAIGIGGFANRLGLEGHVDGSVDFDGSTRDFDRDFGFSRRRDIALAELSWRPLERHQFDLKHYRDERVRRASIDEPLRFSGETFAVQASLRAHVRFEATELSYTGWWLSRPDYTLGIQVGVLRLDGEIGLSGRVESSDVGRFKGEAIAKDHLYAPLVGMSGRTRLGERIRAYAELRAIRLHWNQTDGRALSGDVGLEWFPYEHVGIAVQYSDTWVRAERSKNGFRGELEIGFRGPQVLLKLRY